MAYAASRSSLTAVFGLLIYASRLAVADRRTKMAPFRLELSEPNGQIARLPSLPTEILSPDNQVGNEIQIAVLVAAGHRRTCRVELVGLFVQRADVRCRILSASPQPGEYSPHDDRRAVLVLDNNLFQLLFPVFFELRGRIV